MNGTIHPLGTLTELRKGSKEAQRRADRAEDDLWNARECVRVLRLEIWKREMEKAAK